jgi:hypothetical protein
MPALKNIKAGRRYGEEVVEVYPPQFKVRTRLKD